MIKNFSHPEYPATCDLANLVSPFCIPAFAQLRESLDNSLSRKLRKIFGKNALSENEVTSCKLWSSPKGHFRQKDAQGARNGVVQVFLSGNRSYNSQLTETLEYPIYRFKEYIHSVAHAADIRALIDLLFSVNIEKDLIA